MSEPPPLRGPSFQRKEGDTRMPLSPYRHFVRKRDIFFVRDRSGKVRTADSGKHRTPSDVGSWCFMQIALRRKTERGNEKDPSAALGMTKRGKAYLTFFFNRLRERASASSGPLLPKEGGRYENAAFPVSSLRAEARNLFRSRSIRKSEDSG